MILVIFLCMSKYILIAQRKTVVTPLLMHWVTAFCSELSIFSLSGLGSLNKKDYYGKTALYWAAYKGHRSCIEALLHYGADVNICCRHGGTPLHTVVGLYPDCAIILIQVVGRTRIRAGSRLAPSRWEMALLCNDVSHWLGASLEAALGMIWQLISRIHILRNYCEIVLRWLTQNLTDD